MTVLLYIHQNCQYYAKFTHFSCKIRQNSGNHRRDISKGILQMETIYLSRDSSQVQGIPNQYGECVMLTH